MPPPSWTRREGAVLVEATCKCGHVGKTEYPATYACTACYYSAKFEANLDRAMVLRARADKLVQEAAEFQVRIKAFRKKHPRP